jgi:hypothetical protein
MFFPNSGLIRALNVETVDGKTGSVASFVKNGHVYITDATKPQGFR